jgi:hypothetical protein
MKRQGRKGSQQDKGRKNEEMRERKGSLQGIGGTKKQRRNVTLFSDFLCDENFCFLGYEAALFASGC